MLRLLLCLSALGLISDAAPSHGSGFSSHPIPNCRIHWFGSQFDSFTIDLSDLDYPRLKFNDYNYLGLAPVTSPDFYYEFVDSSVANVVHSGALCGIKVTVTLAASGGPLDVYFLSHGATHAVVVFDGLQNLPNNTYGTFVAEEKVMLQTTYADTVVYTTGCRDSEKGAYKEGDEMGDPKTCTSAICYQPNPPTPTPTCGPSEYCIGNHVCAKARDCVLVGPSIVDFYNEVDHVPNFCARNILDTGSGFVVIGLYRERRLNDTAFLDEVLISYGSYHMYLKQGNRVVVSGEDITNSLQVPQVFGDVMIRQDYTGTTVTYSDTTTLMFNGDLLHVKHAGPSTGLCANVHAPSNNDDYSPDDCTNFIGDPRGAGIDCAAAQAHCKETMAALNTTFDGGPLKYACSHLLCHYPDYDDYACVFLKAYSLLTGQDFPSEASGCRYPHACTDHYCAYHEFCALDKYGEPQCRCRSRDRIYNQYNGGIPYCSADYASLNIYSCFLNEDREFDPYELHLSDSNCTAYYDVERHLYTLKFDSKYQCGGTVEQHGPHIVFRNRVQNWLYDASIAVTEMLWYDFSCSYGEYIRTSSIRIRDGFSSVTHDTKGFSFTLNMSLYDNLDDPNAVVNMYSKLDLNQTLGVKLEITDIQEGALVLVIDDCWTTSEADPDGANNYPLITDGCPCAKYVQIVTNGQRLYGKFYMNVFEYIAAPGADVYLHCKVHLCLQANGDCEAYCSPDGTTTYAPTTDGYTSTTYGPTTDDYTSTTDNP